MCHFTAFPAGPAGSAQKKKNKKKTKPPAASESPASAKKNHRVDRGFLCCTHHEVMIAGLAVLGKEAISNKGMLCTMWTSREVVQGNHALALSSIEAVLLKLRQHCKAWTRNLMEIYRKGLKVLSEDSVSSCCTSCTCEMTVKA